MVVAIRRNQNRPQGPMRVPPKPRSPFGNGQSVWGGMPDYISEQPLPEMPGKYAEFDALMAELNAGQQQGAPMGHQSAAPITPTQGKPQAQAQAQPAFDLAAFGQFEKPKMTWADKLGIIGGTLMDYDGTFGQGNADRARGVYDQTVQEQQAEFDRKRQEQILAAAAAGDPNALFMLDPSLALGEKRDARNFEYGASRDQLGDQRYADETTYGRSRDALSDQRYGQEYADSRNDRREDLATDAATRRSSAERPVALGDGSALVYSPQTKSWEMQNTSERGGMGGGSNGPGTPASDNFYIPTSADATNPFVQLQFGATPTQGAEGGTLFDNGELYTPGASGAQQGGGMPPNIDPNLYQRYRSSEYAKTDAGVAKEARQTAIKITTKTMPQIAQLKALSTQFPSGPLSDASYEAGRWTGGRVGMSKEEQAARDTFVAQTKGFVLDLAQQMKGSLSDSDRAWVETMGARTSMNAESINQVLDVAERMAERQEFYAQGAEVWSNQYGGLSMTDQTRKNFYQAWSDWSAANPITGGTYGGDAPTSGKEGGSKYEKTATNPATGERVGLINGKWERIQ